MAEYKAEFWFFEPLQQLRKLFLTGFVVLIDAEKPLSRLLAACVVTLSSLVIASFVEPFRSPIDGKLFAMQQVLLLVLFVALMLIRLCGDAELCNSFGFDGPFGISVACAVWNLTLFVTILAMIVWKAITKRDVATLRLRHGDEPILTISPEHQYHVFLSQ